MTEPMEPERKIEKLLRAYAKKRRVQAGSPPGLHPAARRRLQEEIARMAPAPDEGEVSLTLWELFRQRWALLLGFALTVFFMAALFLPALSAAKHKAQRETALARYNLLEIGTAVRMFAGDNHQRLPASLDELTNELQLDLVNTILIDPQTGQRFVYVGGGQSLDHLRSNILVAYSPTDKKGRAVLFADGRVEVVNGGQFSELTNRGLPQLVVRKDAELQPFTATADRVTVAGGIAGAAPVSNRLKSEEDRDKSKSANLSIPAQINGELAAKFPAAEPRLDSGGPIRFKNTAGAAPVLANFQVQQTGNAIRIVDADGSVYDGSLMPQNAVAKNETAPMERPVPPAAQAHHFSVTGTNLTLKQNMVFSGNLLAISNPMPNPQPAMDGFSPEAGGGGVGGSQSGTTNRLPWSVLRITGTAVIGSTNTIEINAMPLSP